MAVRNKYLLDANVFIQAKNQYYAFNICPGFWESLLGAFDNGDICTIVQVRPELEVGKDEIAAWIKGRVPERFFQETNAPEVVTRFREVMQWVQNNDQFFESAKNDFATGADGWLIAYAAVHNMLLVTQEQLRPEQRSRVPLPNVARHFGVRFVNTFEMLKAVNIQFVWDRE